MGRNAFQDLLFEFDAKAWQFMQLTAPRGIFQLPEGLDMQLLVEELDAPRCGKDALRRGGKGLMS